jgi:pimeloyl-ACP methyl ester carboxylesterase
MQQIVQVGEIDVYIEGEGAETIVMVHGWPDTHRLWDAQVEELKHRYRCVRFTLPGFDITKKRRSYSLDATMRVFLHVVKQVCPSGKVILMLHDWGCIFGYEFAMRHKALVSCIIAVDVGDATSKAVQRSRSLSQRLKYNGYQSFLALAWSMGGPVGDLLTKWMAGAAKAPAKRRYIHSGMNYPYYIATAGAAGSYHGLLAFVPHCPVLFIYGRRKPFMFHSEPWAETLATRPGCKVIAFDTDHWPMVRQPEKFNQAVLDWLDAPATAEAGDGDGAAAA